jgi:DNA-binding CsgD family transcriptional regulator
MRPPISGKAAETLTKETNAPYGLEHKQPCINTSTYLPMKKLGQYIEIINSSKTPEEAFAKFCSIMKEHGYDRVAYSLVTDHPSLGLPRQHGLATSYPDDWMKYYKEKNYMEIDPVTLRVLASRKPFFWSDVTANPDLFAPSLQLMNEAQEAGVSDGIGFSLTGPPGELVGVGLARTAPAKGKDYMFLAGAYMLSVYFHETYRDMLSKPLKVELTVREREILCWASEGKTDDEMAAILNISLNTIRFHWKKIFKKLEAYGRMYAVMKATRLQLITPALVGSPYQKR